MTAARFLRYFGYAASTILSLFGVLVLAGLLIPSYVPSNFRMLFGVVLVLYGIFRFVSLRFKKPDEEDSPP
jgi:uncharacterized membrane protein HdeD (DUF308 family)